MYQSVSSSSAHFSLKIEVPNFQVSPTDKAFPQGGICDRFLEGIDVPWISISFLQSYIHDAWNGL